MVDDPIAARAAVRPPLHRAPALAAVRALGRVLGWLPRPLAAVAASGWMFTIWWLSSGPIDLEPPLPAADFFWNLAHAPVFGVLAALAAVAVAPRPLPRAWPDPGRTARLMGVAVVAAWAAVDELHQATVPGRNGTPFDWVTDVTGAAGVLWIASYAGRGDACERGLWRRIGIAAALCAAAALATTLHDRAA